MKQINTFVKTTCHKYFMVSLTLSFMLIMSASTQAQQYVTLGNPSSDPDSPICTGQDFQVTFRYSGGGFTPTNQLQEIEIKVTIPAGVEPASSGNIGSIYPGMGNTNTVSYNSTTREVIFNIKEDFSLLNTAGDVYLNLRFPAGTTCNGKEVCFSPSIRYKHNENWTSPVTMNKFICVIAQATNNWTIKKDVMGCRYNDDSSRSVLYRVSVENNRNSNLDVNCSINLYSLQLWDIIPNGATFDAIEPADPPLPTTATWSAASQSGNSYYFTGGPAYLDVNQGSYIVYFWIRYPQNIFPTGPVPNTAKLSAYDSCANAKFIDSSSTSAQLCSRTNIGSQNKSVTFPAGLPNNSSYLPTVSPGCCGRYSMSYSNTGTVNQTGIIMIDQIPENVDFNSVNTHLTPALVSCNLTYSTDGGNTYVNTGLPSSGSISSIGYTTTVLPNPGSITHVKWSYTGTLPVMRSITNYANFCVRNSYRSNSSGFDTDGDGMVEAGETIHNVVSTERTGATLPETAQSNVVIDNDQVRIIANKYFIGMCNNGSTQQSPPNSWWPGQNVRFRIAVANIGNVNATNCIITDQLPQYLTYAGNVNYTWYSMNAPAQPFPDHQNPACNTPTTGSLPTGPVSVTTSANGQIIRWDFSTLPHDCDGNPSFLIIDFDVHISGSGQEELAWARQYCNQYTFNCDELQSEHNSSLACFTVNATSQITGIKEVGLNQSGPFSSSATIGAGQTGYYRVRVKNTGNTQLYKLNLLDILPQNGDQTILPPYQPRNSRYNVSLSGPISITTGSGYFTSVTPKYETLLEPLSRANVGMGFPWTWTGSTVTQVSSPPGAVAGGWTSPANSAHAFQVSANTSMTFDPGKILEFTVPFTVASDAANDSMACNSLAIQAQNPNHNSTPARYAIMTQTAPVCITAINPPSISGDCLCDSLEVHVGPDSALANQYLNFTIHNRRMSPISWVDIQYLDCTTLQPFTLSPLHSYYYELSVGTNPHQLLVRDNPLASLQEPSPNAWLTTPFLRYPKTSVGNFPGFTPSSNRYQDRVHFTIGRPYTPLSGITTSCIRLIVHHENGDSCILEHNDWTPSIPTDSGGLTPHTQIDRTNWVLDFNIDNTHFTGHTIGTIDFMTLDSTTTIIGGTGGTIEADPYTNWDSPVSIFVHTPRRGRFNIKSLSKISAPISIFISSNNGVKKPKLRWRISNTNAKIISEGTIEVSRTVIKVDPPIIVPGDGGVLINSIVPNPASGEVKITYTINANDLVRLELFDMLGKSFGVVENVHRSEGRHEVSYNVGLIPEGSYVLRLSTQNGHASAVVKIIH